MRLLGSVALSFQYFPNGDSVDEEKYQKKGFFVRRGIEIKNSQGELERERNKGLIVFL